ncbi:MAG TPA: alpha/beta hydrolase [Verrucomicrobiota bacterium]|nr:xylanase [Verrucomicrobiales bacterium]HRI12951.1 alpha/beta hydrolase [Verrucomicrobiota bacterium]
MHFLSVLLAGALLVLPLAAQTIPVINLWPGTAPGDEASALEEKDLTKDSDNLVAGRRLIRLGQVFKPSLTVFRPPAEKETGAAVLVCPGGGYNILAWDLEGTEVCEWLNSIGVTGVLLKYRVPKRAGRPDHAPALQDAQRALGLVRSRAKEFGIDPRRIGVLGFSAGGNLAAILCNQYSERSYPAVDAADQLSCRPDFAILIYPAYLTDKDNGDKLRPEVPITTNTPPTFQSITQDDPVRMETSLFYCLALKQAGVPNELHVYPQGGHGYGLRRTDNPATFWPDRAADWMKFSGWLKKP